MKAIELFSGIGGFRIACDSLGIETVWANDISPAAAKVYQQRFGEENYHFGDIADYLDNIPDHDLLTGGFPCQPFSSAGRKLGLEDARGTLFEKIVHILEQKKPKYFVLENVKRLLSMDNGKHFATILDALSGIGYLVEWRLLNAVNFGLPQYRERVVIVGRRDHSPKSYLCTSSDISELTPHQAAIASNTDHWKSIEDHGSKFHPWGVALNGRFFHAKIEGFSEAEKSVKLKDVLEERPDCSFYFTEDTLERIKNSEEVNRFYNGVEILYNQKGGARMGYSIFGVEGVAPTLTCTTSRHYERYKIGGEFRRLTAIEYARIQGFPDDHCASARLYTQYPLYGNAVPPALVRWAIKRTISNTGTNFESSSAQMELV
ncbi:MAG: DNA (cytosine-5-)-methyltransferase [Pseudomonas sp.]|jgi:DNA (cytosine-5)-methyltransferase 1|uniref:DNA cytosine methyltransferase n=1 Tax=Pseudomonas sp. TaxID=306 RepID=UPI002721F652|nr:DNA (cytosine-5-)-methyltransferase [Pseudomonas sp.]MDO9619584.1 DNA (cytosine-5-)-methyltransferase [Pseudomonas sp.]MDP2446125.1 DNA (cytosine-5-)-methyltransferase [Pseudomonas sp.]MDZ4335306.1 DNA (cytosine-5-)-methyltransferase [Pseudomonas sp.]